MENYKKERNFYFDLNILPSAVCQNNEELVNKNCNFDEEEYLDKLKIFEDEMGVCKCGIASEKIVELYYSTDQTDQ